MPLNLDEIDVKLLFQLQKNARVSAQEISKRIHLSANAVSARIKKLEDKGYIKQYVTVLNKTMVDRRLMSFTGISLIHNNNANMNSFLDFVKQIPEVCHCYHINGMFDFLLHVVAIDMQDYRNFLVNTLAKFESINGIITFFVLDEMGLEHYVDLTHLLKRKSLN